jgi:hypothetical protein
MKTWPRSKIIRKNEAIVYSFEQKYTTLIDRVNMSSTPKEQFAEIIRQCSDEYTKTAKGVSNLNVLIELLRKLYLRIFLRFKENEEYCNKKI